MCVSINYWAVFVSVLASIALGFLWYTPIGFGKQWSQLVGLKEEDVNKKDAMKGFISSIITSLIQTVSLAVVLGHAGASGLASGLSYGATIGIGFISTTLWNNDVYEKRSSKLTWINAGYRIVYFLIAGAILGVWQ